MDPDIIVGSIRGHIRTLDVMAYRSSALMLMEHQPNDTDPDLLLPVTHGELRSSALIEDQPDDSTTVVGLTSQLESKVFCVRKNDPHTFSLCIGSGLDPRAWKQLGRWLGHKNTHVKYFCLLACHLKGESMVDLCTGLEHNESISEFEISDCQLKSTEIRSLAPFIRNNPSLHTLNIEGCLRAPVGGVDLLSSALMCRAQGQSIENISLDNNFMGNEESKETFDSLIVALNNNRELTRCSFMANAIGKSECTSLARLFKNPDSKLKSIILRHNRIDDECAALLSASLTNNSALSNIDLDRNQMTAKGLMAFLDLISKTPGATVQLTARWTHVPSKETTTILTKIKINRPLQHTLLELGAKHHVRWASDLSHVKLSRKNSHATLRRTLDCGETPFFYGMQEGDVLDITKDTGGAKAAPTVPKAERGGSHGLRDTIASNHTLSSLGYETARHRNFIHGSLLRECLDANKSTDKRSTIRTKVFRRHIRDHLSPDDFCDMDAVLHRVLAWILRGLSDTEEGRRLEVMYRIVRGMPMLCGC